MTELQEALRVAIERAGSARKLAKEWDVSHSFICNIAAGRKGAGKAIRWRLGLSPPPPPRRRRKPPMPMPERPPNRPGRRADDDSDDELVKAAARAEERLRAAAIRAEWLRAMGAMPAERPRRRPSWSERLVREHLRRERSLCRGSMQQDR